ncbi:MAG: cation diffusion facilitator family transporter [Legionellaceae bacterium]|nr:cation diffusion facilitator family transporter [Legionellaceae bacterium]
MAHCHSGNKTTSGNAFIIAIVANSVFVVFQIICAQLANSTSLFADAIHNLGDVLSLGVAWVGNVLLTRESTDKTTYGLKKASILAALANVLLLVFTCGIIAYEATLKFFAPTVIDNWFVMLVAGIGVAVNALTALLFIRGGNDLNIRAAYLHLASDALISLGVVAAAGLMLWSGWLWVDPVVGLLIAAIILRSTWTLLSDSTRLILDGVPSHISVGNVRALLMEQDGVEDVHDLHIWAMSTKENALSVHLLMPETPLTDTNRYALNKLLLDKHNINHATIQVECIRGYCDDSCDC